MKLKQATEPKLPMRVCAIAAVALSAVISAAAGMSFILISGAAVAVPVMVFSTAVLVLLPAFIMKTYSVFSGFRSRQKLTALILSGFTLSLWATFSYYVSHDYELSVYRYMRSANADEYYLGGYDSFTKDYFDGADFMAQMKSAPASIILEGMSSKKLSALTASQLKTINSRSLWDYLGFNEILGSTADEVETSLRASRSMNAYEFTFDYRGLRAKTFGYMLIHQSQTADELSDIAGVGSHSVDFPVLLAFLISQFFSIYVIGMHFDINAKGQLIYIYEPASGRKNPGILRGISNTLAEMRSHWIIK